MPVGNDWSLDNTISGRKPIQGLSPTQQKWEEEKRKTLEQFKNIGGSKAGAGATTGQFKSVGSTGGATPLRFEGAWVPAGPSTAAGTSDGSGPPRDGTTAVSPAPQDPAERAAAITRSGMLPEHAEAFSQMAHEKNEIYMLQGTNPAATPHVGFGIPKPMEVHISVAPSGPAGGYIPVDPAHNSRAGADYVAEVKRLTEPGPLGTELTPPLARKVQIPDPDRPGETITVLGEYRTGRPFVSDYDFLTIGRARGKQPGEPIQHDVRGFITPSDRNSIDELHNRIGQVVAPHAPASTAPPERDPGIKFPITTHDPDGRILSFDNEGALKQYVNDAERRGYLVPINPNWGWQRDASGRWR